MDKRLITVPEMAIAAGVSLSTIKRWRSQDDDFPKHVNRKGKTPFYLRVDWMKYWLDKNMIKSIMLDIELNYNDQK